MLIRNKREEVTMNPESILNLVQSIRDELGLERGVTPIIRKIYTHSDGSLHIITSDKSEKSLLLGPRGRISAELSKRLAVPVTIYGADELLLRKYRLEQALTRIEELTGASTKMQQGVLETLRKLIEHELEFPEESTIKDLSVDKSVRIAVAFSGGVDSSAALVILKECGFEPEAITVDLGHEFVNPKEITKIGDWCFQIGLKQILIPPRNAIIDIVQRTRDGRIHPCGECHAVILDSVREYAIENGYSVMITGELLPAGRQSIEDYGQLITIHLPGALALSKHRTEVIAKENSKVTNQKTFGCRLLNDSHDSGWKMTGPSIFRVLRELEAGILTSGQALEYIKSVVKGKQTRGKD
jgi:predicted PP-loop superfamily ATPase